MLKEYYFYDAKCGDDVYEEYELKGDAYKELLRICEKYCKAVSFQVWPFDEWYEGMKAMDTVLMDAMEKFQISDTDKYKSRVGFCSMWHPRFAPVAITQRKYYKVCPELIELLLRTTDDLFEWRRNSEFGRPEDPIFYRSDGSVFFSSVIHEGELKLTPREGEDITSLLQLSVWWKDRRQHKRMYGTEADLED